MAPTELLSDHHQVAVFYVSSLFVIIRGKFPQHDCGALTAAFSGLGVEESALISLGNWQREQRNNFRKSAPKFFSEDERQFEKWNQDLVSFLDHEFLRFKRAIVEWTMHPWERDARLMKKAISMGPEGYGLILEIGCTRSSEELLGARKAYHSLFDHSIEEDVAFTVNGAERKLLVALVSSYRYEGGRVNDDAAKSEARILHGFVQSADTRFAIENDDVVRILSTRSKLHLQTLSKHYKEITGNTVSEDLQNELILKSAVQCLCAPEIYFSEALDESLKEDADEYKQEMLTRVIISQADSNLKDICAAYKQLYGVELATKIKGRARGNFRDFLLSLVAREE